MGLVAIQHSRNAVFQTAFHIVFCPKYRRALLTGQIKERLVELLRDIAQTKGLTILSLEVLPDHVHLFCSISPAIAPATVVKWCKGISARKLLLEFSDLRHLCHHDHLWSPSYYLGTAGNVNAATIRRYIEEMQHEKRR